MRNSVLPGFKTAAIGFCLSRLALPLLVGATGFDRGKLAEIDAEIEQAIAETNLPGAVLWIEHQTNKVHKA